MTADVKNKGSYLFRHFYEKLKGLNDELALNQIPFEYDNPITNFLYKYVTEEMCQYVSFEALKDELISNGYVEDDIKVLKNLYMNHLHTTDENTLEIFEKYKVSEVPMGLPADMWIEQRGYYEACMAQKKIEQQKQEKVLAQQQKREDKKRLREAQKQAIARQSTNSGCEKSQ